MHLLMFICTLVTLALCACKPTGAIDTSESTDVVRQQEVEVQAAKAPTPDREAYSNEVTQPYTVLTDPWSKYFRSEPRVYILPELSDGVEKLIREQQGLAKEILSSSGKIQERPEFLQLEEELELLKTAVPGAETRSGYGRAYRSYSPGYTYVSPDGSYAYARTGTSNRYYTVFRNVHKSSSPDLARSVENIVHNASVEDLSQRIDALQQLVRVWSRKTNVMSPNGVEGLMREANLAYLSSLRGYTSEWLHLNGRVRNVESIVTREKAMRAQRLEEWKSFEENRLPVIEEYVVQNHSHLATGSGGSYELPLQNNKRKAVLLACEIGERTLFFDLSQGTHPDHPFRLVSMGE